MITTMNPWKNEMHTSYSFCPNTTYIRISIMEDDTVVYTFVLEDLIFYRNVYGKNDIYDYIILKTLFMDPKDYSVLTSKHYNKYVVEVQQMWRNAETGQDELIELPSRVFKNMTISYEYDDDEDDTPAWVIEFENIKY